VVKQAQSGHAYCGRGMEECILGSAHDTLVDSTLLMTCMKFEGFEEMCMAQGAEHVLRNLEM
jgi:hypothetical protein